MTNSANPLHVLPPSFDHTRIAVFHECPRKFYYMHVRNRYPGGGETSGGAYPLEFGVAYHKFRHVLEVSGDFEQALQAALDHYKEDPPLEHKKYYLDRDRLRQTCKIAYDWWAAEKKEGQIVVVGSELPFEVTLPSGRILSGVIDQTVEVRGRGGISGLLPRDFKTTSREGPTWEVNLSPYLQFSIYPIALQTLSGRPVGGAIVERVYNTAKQGPEIRERFVGRSPGNLEDALRTIESTLDMIEQCHKTGYYPMHTNACGQWSGCPFRDACNTSSEEARERWLESQTVERVWDPLQDRGDPALAEVV